MDDAGVVRELHGAGEHFNQLGGAGGRPRVAGEALGQAAAVHELERQVRVPVRLADVENLDDVRVLERRDRFRLAAEPLPLGRPGVRAGQDHLERDRAVQVEVPGLVHDAHAAAADLVNDLVTGHQRRGEVGRLRDAERHHAAGRPAGRGGTVGLREQHDER